MARIIIADDDELVIDIARAALEQRGHIVGALSNGFKVNDVVRTKRPDLVILDCVMPELSGLEALRQLRSSGAGYATPILMLTARRSEADEEIALRAGADDYLRKPFCPDELVACVEALLARSRHRLGRIANKPVLCSHAASGRSASEPCRQP